MHAESATKLSLRDVLGFSGESQLFKEELVVRGIVGFGDAASPEHFAVGESSERQDGGEG
jgi:hypothetical protein